MLVNKVLTVDLLPFLFTHLTLNDKKILKSYQFEDLKISTRVNPRVDLQVSSVFLLSICSHIYISYQVVMICHIWSHHSCH